MKKHITILLTAGITLLSMLQTATAQTLTITLTTSNHNGFNVSCFGGIDGSINATVTGGNAPYTYLWSNGATTQNITGLAAGYYNLVVKDFSGTISQRNEVTLTEPQALRLTPSIYEYPNGYNISLYNAYNGSIAITITGGVTNYNYLWDDGTVTQNRASLGAGAYIVTVTDANACTVKSEQINLRQPDRSDWRMDGNNGSNPTTNFIGTKDSVDFSLRTNNAERFRIAGNGDLKIGKLAGNGNSLLYVDNNGFLRGYDPGNVALPHTPWMTTGNNNITGYDYIGTINNADLIIKTFTSENPTPSNGTEVMRVTANKRVGIGTSNPQHKLEVANGLIRSSHDNTGGATAGTMDIGYDGMHGIINSSGDLLINLGNTNNTTISNNLSVGNDLYVNGKIGVGTSTPNEKLHINGNIQIDGNKIILGKNDGYFQGSNTNNCFVAHSILHDQLLINYNNDFEGGVAIGGKVGIGGDPPDPSSAYKLVVWGKIGARELRLTLTNPWPDFIFNEDCNLISLEDLETFIKKYKHLPEVPDAITIEKQGGYDTGAMNILLLKKIEELTLYVISLKKEIVVLQNNK